MALSLFPSLSIFIALYVCVGGCFHSYILPAAYFIRSYGCSVGNKTEFLASADLTEEEFQENPIINWDAILWVNRPVELWGVQLVLALISLTEALLITYLGYKVSDV